MDITVIDPEDRREAIYSKSFKLHQGGKGANPQERTLVRDWGERTQPTQKQLEG